MTFCNPAPYVACGSKPLRSLAKRVRTDMVSITRTLFSIEFLRVRKCQDLRGCWKLDAESDHFNLRLCSCHFSFRGWVSL